MTDEKPCVNVKQYFITGVPLTGGNDFKGKYNYRSRLLLEKKKKSLFYVWQEEPVFERRRVVGEAFCEQMVAF